MSEAENDKYILEITKLIFVDRNYDKAINQCTVALNSYDTIRLGMKEFQQIMEDIKADAVSMQTAAGNAASSLKDEVGAGIVDAVESGALRLIRACSDGEDEMDADMDKIQKKEERVKDLRTIARQLREEERKLKEQRERDDDGFSR